ncbi:hypothetical protein BCR39DRAFT_493567 [Naematelia encephala]|uniref:C2H2-type domain-containing protein n=1 Tax=Naematelia encephala TaxID=71784 RepID=A0A1Y2B9N5_9TREE|nr:hypothetical protein BCR39DRAFT_493567 [Naematelia encephala]
MLAVQQRDTDVFQSQYLDPSLLSPPPSSATSISLPTTVPLKRKTRPISSNAEAGPSRPPPPPCRTERRFTCDYPGCDKAYFKPSRLAEHQLTHSGERPHQCPHCAQCYLRASHLHAHLRTHLSQDDKQFTCSRPGCDKKFWTATHLKRHDQTHDQAPVYSCKHCEESFTKVHLLRDHVVLAHMPAGTKPYMCTNEGCDSSFSLKSHLKTHMKTHDGKLPYKL